MTILKEDEYTDLSKEKQVFHFIDQQEQLNAMASAVGRLIDEVEGLKILVNELLKPKSKLVLPKH